MAGAVAVAVAGLAVVGPGGVALAQEDAGPLVVRDVEGTGTDALNDSADTAQAVPGFGSTAEAAADAALTGTVAVPPAPPLIGPFPENDGSLPLASRLGLSTGRPDVRVTGRIGDGPHGLAGDGRGDVDVFAVGTLRAGQTLALRAAVPDGSELQPQAQLLRADGTRITTFFLRTDPQGRITARTQVEEAGEYVVAVDGGGALQDPFDAASGDGARSEGDYELTFYGEGRTEDVDLHAVDLRAGDVLGAGLALRGGLARILDPTGRELFATSVNQARLLPRASTLPKTGDAVAYAVATSTGRYLLEVSGPPGEYRVDLAVRRPAMESRPAGSSAVLFLDFDGGQVDTSVLRAAGGPAVRTLSPLSAFLPGWGLGPAEEDAVVDAVVATVRENLVDDVAARGTNPSFALEVRNSRDHPDPTGEPGVLRAVVGGTPAESGVDAVGRAESTDPGNLVLEETALLHLSTLSAPTGSGGSLNDMRGPDTDMVALVGTGVGNLITHEIGHTLGGSHTAPAYSPEPPFADLLYNLMDSGSFLEELVGVGDDGVFGTPDDRDADFGLGVLSREERATGVVDSLQVVSWALPTGSGPAAAPGDGSRPGPTTPGTPGDPGGLLGNGGVAADALALTSLCSADPAQTRRWQLSNVSTTPYEVVWSLFGTDRSGTVQATAGEVVFETPVLDAGDPNTVTASAGGTQITVKASGGARC